MNSKKKKIVSAKKSASVLFEETLSLYMRSSTMIITLPHKRSAFEYIAGPRKRQIQDAEVLTIGTIHGEACRIIFTSMILILQRAKRQDRPETKLFGHHR
jgi:hypothetical protein